MSLKQVKRIIETKDFYKNADTVNHEGFPAFSYKPEDRLRELLFLGNTGNTFYVKQRDWVAEITEDLNKLISELNVDYVAETIVSARNEGLFRHIPMIALILLKKKSPEQFRKIFSNVILTGQDLSDYFDLSRSLGIKWGSSAKKAIHEWLRTKATPFYALKYRKQIADAIAISRPRIDDFHNSDVLKYAYYLKNKKIILNNTPEQIKFAEVFKSCVAENKIDKAIYFADKGKLPADLIISLLGYNSDKDIWFSIAKNMGTMQFLKYLNKLSKVLNFRDLKELVERKITVENLQKAKVFPYSVFVAWQNVEYVEIRTYLGKVFSDYIYVYDYDLWKNFTYFVAPDVSGSMSGRPAEIAGYFSAVLGKGLNNAEIYLWDTNCKALDITNMDVIGVCDEVFKAPGGGTDMSSPIRYALQNKVKRDIFIVITDNEHWYGTGDDTFMHRWYEYKTTINKNAKAVIIEVEGYGHSQVDYNFAERFDVFTVFGWSDSVFKWIEMKVLGV